MQLKDEFAANVVALAIMNVVKNPRVQSIKDVSKPTKAVKLNLYQEIPNLEVSLDDFEEFALDRQKVCRKSRICV